MKKIFLLAVAVFGIAFSSTAQEEESSFSVGADFQSRYVWRGLQLGENAPSIQPAATLSWKGLSVGVWGAFQTVGTTNQELDLNVSYTFANEMFTAQVTDYCFPWLTQGGLTTHRYFDYNPDSGSHIFEAGFKFNGLEKLPFAAEVYVNFYNDEDYSTYAEVSYNPTVEKWGLDLNVFAGCSFTKSAVYQTEKFGFINVGLGFTKQLKISDSFTLPIYTRLTFNPDANNAFLVFGMSVSI